MYISATDKQKDLAAEFCDAATGLSPTALANWCKYSNSIKNERRKPLANLPLFIDYIEDGEMKEFINFHKLPLDMVIMLIERPKSFHTKKMVFDWCKVHLDTENFIDDFRKYHNLIRQYVQPKTIGREILKAERVIVNISYELTEYKTPEAPDTINLPEDVAKGIQKEYIVRRHKSSIYNSMVDIGRQTDLNITITPDNVTTELV